MRTMLRIPCSSGRQCGVHSQCTFAPERKQRRENVSSLSLELCLVLRLSSLHTATMLTPSKRSAVWNVSSGRTPNAGRAETNDEMFSICAVKY